MWVSGSLTTATANRTEHRIENLEVRSEKRPPDL